MLFTALRSTGRGARIGLVELYETDPAPPVEAILANDGESLATLKRAIALGRRSDAEQDRRFDALIAGPVLAERLEALRRK